MAKIILRGYIVVSDSDLSLVRAELAKHIELTEQEEGCLVFNVSPDSKNQNIFHVYEEFSGLEAFEAHQARVKSSRWGEVTVNVKRYYKVESDSTQGA